MTLRNPSPRAITIIKVAVFLAALIPLARYLDGVFLHPERLGVNPAEALIRGLGDWALRFLLATLALTPLRRVTGWAWLVRLRRMLGLFAFFYASIHFLSYTGFDQLFDLGDILKDIAKRPFITVGFICLVLMLPLAVTSTRWMVRKLGGMRWQKLHRLIYIIGPLAVLHFWWMVKRDLTEPIIYAAILTLLLGARLVWKAKSGRGNAAQASRTTAGPGLAKSSSSP